MELRFANPALPGTTSPVCRVHWTNDVHVQTEAQLLVSTVKSTTKMVMLRSTTAPVATQTTIGVVVPVHCAPRRAPLVPSKLLPAMHWKVTPIKIGCAPHMSVRVIMVLLQQEQVVRQMLRSADLAAMVIF